MFFRHPAPIRSCTNPGAAGRADLAGGMQSHKLMRSSLGLIASSNSVLANCQPWFYLRLVAYGFVGLSEGAYGGHETSPLERRGLSRRKILTLEPERSVPANRAYDDLAFRQARRAQAACDSRCSASNDSPFFQIFRAMAAILRAKVKRAISGRIPFFSSPR